MKFIFLKDQTEILFRKSKKRIAFPYAILSRQKWHGNKFTERHVADSIKLVKKDRFGIRSGGIKLNWKDIRW